MNLFLPMLAVGLVTSVHCVAMCGSMVLTYAVKDETAGGWKRKMLPHLAYQSAKIVSYVVVGLALGAIGAAFDLGGVRGWVMAAAGLFMVLLGLQMTGRFPVLRSLSPRPPKFLVALLMRTRRKAADQAAEGNVSLATPMTFGLLTGLMPCGPLQGAQLAAAAAGSPVWGAVAMLGFGLGTAPLMLGFGALTGALGAKFQKRMMVVAAVLVMGLGLVMLNRGAMLLGSPVTAQSVRTAVLGGQVVEPEAAGAGFARGADGIVEVPLVIENVRFVPSTLRLPADERVRLIVDRREDDSCSDQIAVPQLGVLQDLTPFGTTVVELPAAKVGTYTLTCGMGMMSGQLSVGAAGATASRSVGVSPALLVALAAIIFGLYRTRPRPAPSQQHGAGGKSGARPVPERDSTATVLGFKPSEVLIIGGALGVAVLLGLAIGGVFTY